MRWMDAKECEAKLLFFQPPEIWGDRASISESKRRHGLSATCAEWSSGMGRRINSHHLGPSDGGRAVLLDPLGAGPWRARHMARTPGSGPRAHEGTWTVPVQFLALECGLWRCASRLWGGWQDGALANPDQPTRPTSPDITSKRGC